MSEFDELLDDVLRESAQTEPLHGLEDRILVRISAEDVQRRIGWRYAVIVPAGVVLAAVVIVGLGHQRFAKPIEREATSQISKSMPAEKAASSKNAEVVVSHVSRTKVSPTRAAIHEELPKMDVFPTPSPPDESVVLLMRSENDKAVKALKQLQQESYEPIRIAQIEVEPLHAEER